MIYITYHSGMVKTVKARDILCLKKRGDTFCIDFVTETGETDWWAIGCDADETADGIPDSVKVDNELYIGHDGIERLRLKLEAKWQQMELAAALEEL